MRIGLLDFHKKPAQGLNLYTRNIAVTLRMLQPDLDLDTVKLFDNEKVRPDLAHQKRFDITTYDGVVLSGTDYTHSHRSHLMRTLVHHVVADATAQRKSVLGVCSGFQLLARAHGYDVDYLKQPEAAWYSIRLTDRGRNTPLFKGIPNEFPGFSTHAKQVIVNGTWDEAVLAANDNCVQSIVFHAGEGYYIYGTQFHPEDTHESAIQYLNEYDTALRGAPVATEQVPMPATLFGHQILRNFLELITHRPR